MSRHFCYYCRYYSEHPTPSSQDWIYGEDWNCSADFERKQEAIEKQGENCQTFEEGDWKHRKAIVTEYIFNDGRKLEVIDGSGGGQKNK